MDNIKENITNIVKYIKNIENIELYIIVFLIVFLIWFIFNTKKFYHGEKRKVKNLHRFAKEGEVEAQRDLAIRYQKGKMVKKSCNNAAFWYNKAALSGDEKAKNHLKNFLEKQKKHKNKC
jgi:TPR repeat protein